MVDYVILGAGSAGCVLAHRLSEDPDVSVLLIEAGDADRAWNLHIPAAFSRLFQSQYDWAYFTEPQSQLNQRQLYVPRGKVLGGSSSINAMIYTRGSPYDYDLWRDLGNPGWGYADVLPYFRKAENHEAGVSEYHGVGGPLNVAALREINPLTRAFVEAGIELGLAQNSDFSGAQQEGVGFHQVTQKGGQRCSAADAYLKPIRSRPNLTISTRTSATRLISRAWACRWRRVHPRRGTPTVCCRARSYPLVRSDRIAAASASVWHRRCRRSQSAGH